MTTHSAILAAQCVAIDTHYVVIAVHCAKC